jgi:hypothetical protein
MAHHKLLSNLSQSFLEILDQDDYYHDITIEVGRVSNVETFNAHMVILFYRCPYMRKILLNSQNNNDEDMHIKLPNISPEIFQMILR